MTKLKLTSKHIMFLEQNIRPKSISIEVRNLKQNNWFEYIRMYKQDGWGANDIIPIVHAVSKSYYNTPTFWKMAAVNTGRMTGINVVRVKTLLGEQLYNNNACTILSDASNAESLSICLPGESANATIIKGVENIQKHIQNLSKENGGFASYHYVIDDSTPPWAKLKCNNKKIFHVSFKFKESPIKFVKDTKGWTIETEKDRELYYGH